MLEQGIRNPEGATRHVGDDRNPAIFPTDRRFIAPVPGSATKKAWAALCSSFSAS
jgi:hypothetical protein